MKISLITAVGANGEIGQAGDLPWPRLRRDVSWFVKNTTGKPIIMGRKTWDSLPRKPLGNRANIVLSRSWPGVEGPVTSLGCDIVKSVDAAIKAGHQYRAAEAVVIGGAEVYRAFLPLAETIYLTKVGDDFPEADTFFPAYPLPIGEWVERPAHDRFFREQGYGLGFYVYDRG